MHKLIKILYYSYIVDLYLSGSKGFVALKSAINSPSKITTLRILPDPGVLNDPYNLMIEIANQFRITIVSHEHHSTNPEAMAVGWKYIINKPYEKLFVIHDSLLPKYRGWNPLVSALQNKENKIGATLILADEQVDHGPIIKQIYAKVNYPIKIEQAMKIVEELIGELTLYLFKQENRNNFNLQIQKDRKATYSIWRDEADYMINWNKSSNKILLFIDSVSFPYKGALTTLNNQKIRILEAKSTPDILIMNRSPGKVWKINNDIPTVLCGEGAIEILKMVSDTDQNQIINLRSVRSRFL